MAGKKKPVDIDSESDDEDYAFKPSWKDEDSSNKGSSGKSNGKSSATASSSAPSKKKDDLLARLAAKKKSSVRSSPATSDHEDDDEEDVDSTRARSGASSRDASRVRVSSDAEGGEEEEEEDRDEWRLANRIPRDKLKNDSKYQQQVNKWEKFCQSFPIPFTAQLSAGAILALRKQLKGQRKLVYQGIPVHLRRDVWELLSGARAFPEKLEHADRFRSYLSHAPTAVLQKQIAADAPRALRSHLKFTTKGGQGELIRVLNAFAARSPAIGYASPTSHIVGFLLLFYPEERAFWLLCTLVDVILPLDYYASSLLGARADAQLIKILVFQRLPKLHAHLEKMHQDVANVVLKWIMPLFLTVLPVHVCIRLFDILMLDGANLLVSTALALFTLHQKKILSLQSEEDMAEFLDAIGNEEKSIDSDALIEMALSSKCALSEEELKRRETERRIMETAYMKDLQVTQKARRLEEERKRKEEEAKRQTQEEEERALSYGTEMWKIGKSGKPRKTFVYLKNESTDAVLDREKRLYTLSWQSKSKQDAECRLLLRECELHLGMQHGQFVKRPDVVKPFASQAHQAFSFISPARSLDLICTSNYDHEQWLNVLMRIPMKLKPETKKSADGKMKISNSSSLGHHEEEEEEQKRPSASSGNVAKSNGISKQPLSVKEKLAIGRDKLAKKPGVANNRLASLLATPAPDINLDFSDDEDEGPARTVKKKR